MYNLRYHIASLVAVFLALAIGLILGGLVVRQGGFDSQQKALVSSLRSEYNKIKTSNTELKSSLAFESGYAKQMTDSWVAGRLAGSTVVVVNSTASNEGAEEAQAAVKSAGGSVALVTLQLPEFGLRDSQVASSVAAVLRSTTASPTATDVAKQLVVEWTGGSSTHALTDVLVSAGVMKTEGLTRSTVATLAVDVASMDHDPDPAGLEVAAAYASLGHFALGAERFDSQTGVAAAASARKLSALDTLGTDPGRFTLVALLTGGQQGFYSNTVRGVSAYPQPPTP
jgi:hypothetical protein